MIGKLIHSCHERRPIEAGHMILHCPDKAVTVSIHALIVFVAVLLHSGEEPGHRLHKGVIIHDGIPLVSFQPGPCISVMLCQNNGIGICFLYIFSEIPPELMIVRVTVSQISRHIQTPAVCIIRRGNPFSSYMHNVIIQFL